MLIEATQFCVTVGSNRGIYKKKQQNYLKRMPSISSPLSSTGPDVKKYDSTTVDSPTLCWWQFRKLIGTSWVVKMCMR